jgi:acetyltransferase-like isoleucine patch superfamily enzyme
MRAISGLQLLAFALCVTVIMSIGIPTVIVCNGLLPPSEYRPIAGTFIGILIIYLAAFGVYRLFLAVMPLQVGNLEPGSRAEFSAQVNILFYLVFFNTLIRTHFIPVPVMRLVYQALGAQLGKNTYSAGTLLDPPMTSLGDNCIVGHDAVIFAHAIEGPHMALAPVRIGNNVTIGAMAVVMAGVTIEDDAIVSAGAVVRKDTRIKRGEIWGGVPAKCVGQRAQVLSEVNVG